MGVALWAMGVAPLAKMGVAGHPTFFLKKKKFSSHVSQILVVPRVVDMKICQF
jgi:hypothetical protein